MRDVAPAMLLALAFIAGVLLLCIGAAWLANAAGLG